MEVIIRQMFRATRQVFHQKIDFRSFFFTFVISQQHVCQVLKGSSITNEQNIFLFTIAVNLIGAEMCAAEM